MAENKIIIKLEFDEDLKDKVTDWIKESFILKAKVKEAYKLLLLNQIWINPGKGKPKLIQFKEEEWNKFLKEWGLK